MRAAPVAVALLLSASLAQANDVWIEPEAFVLDAGDATSIRIRAGHGSRTADLPRPAELQAFTRYGPGGGPVAGAAGDDESSLPALRAGVHTVAFHSAPRWIEHPADRFERYLRSEGLSLPRRLRAQAGRKEVPGREVVVRCAKALLQVGGVTRGKDRRVGLPVELVCEDTPFQLLPTAGHLEPLPVRLYAQGKPVAGAWIKLSSLGPYKRIHRLRTDAEGRVRVRLPSPGRWLLSTVHMRPGVDFAPWESGWASLSFETRRGEGPVASAVYRRVLAQAIRSGAIQRALGVHHFEFARTWWEPDGTELRVDRFLMTYTIEHAVEAKTIRVTARVRPVGANHTIVIDYTTGLDGRVRSLDGSFGSRKVKVRLENGQLATHREGQPPQLSPHVDAVLPKVAGVFLLPILFDQGLPTRVPIRDLNPFGTVTQPMVFRRLRDDEPGARPGHVAYVTEEGNQRFTTRILVLGDGPRKGELQQIRTESVHRVEGEERPRSMAVSNRITPQRYAELERELFGG